MAIREETAEAGVDVRANRYDVLSRLADDLAHEIKNPLNAVVVNLEVLRRRIQAGAGDAALERAGVIEQELRRVHGLVDQVLQLMRPARAGAAPVAVDGILATLLPALEIQAKAARVELTGETESDLYAQVRAEPFKFALLNLVTSAIDAETGGEGLVRIHARRLPDGIRIAVVCGHALLDADEAALQFCRTLMEEAGGGFEAPSPPAEGTGSVTTLLLPLAKFA